MTEQKQNVDEYVAGLDDIPGVNVFATRRAHKGYWVD